MYKVMIVDDEVVVRKGIKTSIVWSDYGIDIVAEAKNGKEALEQLQQHEVDLILSDIRMPVMSGIEMAMEVKERYPHVEMVLLSGYEDFQYAKQAMTIGIRHYLLKPVMADHLIEIIVKLQTEENRKRKQVQQEITKSKLILENLPHMKKRLMANLLHTQTTAEDIIQKASTLHVDLSGPNYRLLEIQVHSGAHQAFGFAPSIDLPSIQMFSIANIIEETIACYGSALVSYESNKWLALISHQQNIAFFEINSLLKLNIKQYAKQLVYTSYSKPFYSLDEAAFHYKQLRGCACCERTTGTTAKLVNEAIKFLMNHYHLPIGLSEAAEHVAVTPSYLSKVFKDEVGIPLTKWFNMMKMEEAKRLLKHTWLKTYEVAEKVGFQDYKYFSLMFKKHTGLSPREYRNQD